MTTGQLIVGAALAAFAVFYFRVFFRRLLTTSYEVDDLDKSVHEFKIKRLERGLCPYCGGPTPADRVQRSLTRDRFLKCDACLPKTGIV